MFSEGQKNPSPTILRYLEGLRGVEIGGASTNEYHLDVINVDRTIAENKWTRYQMEHAGWVKPIDVIAEAHALPFEDDSFDFVLTSHVIEHMPDPIGCIKEWMRVASKYVALIIPDKSIVQEDMHQRRTRLSEFVKRHTGEWWSESSIRDDNMDEMDGHIHLTFWLPRTFHELADHMGLNVVEFVSPDDKVGNGMLAIIKVN